MTSGILAAIFGIVVLAGCSVLEQRRDCPCHLVLDLSDPANASCDSVLVLICENGRCLDTLDYGSESFSQLHYVEVKNRTGVYVDVADKRHSSYCSASGFLIPIGEDCPEAWLHSSFCDTSEDECVCPVRLCKDYCGVAMTFVAGNPGKYRMKIKGMICGYATDGSPADGEFICSPEFGEECISYFRVPRQKEPTLVLEIVSPDGAARNFALGSYIESSGYDWNKRDLDDIAVSIDYAGTQVSINVNDWVTVEYFDIVI